MPQAARRVQYPHVLATTVLLLLGALPVRAADANSELLARIRQHMAENLARLPNYTCRETVERTGGPAGSHHFELLDRLRLEVAYVGGKELYAWPGAANFDEQDITEMVGPGGAIGTGNFAMHARAVFTTDAPEFTWAGEEQRDGRRVVRFDFRVPRNKSRYAIQTGDQPLIVAYEGFVEADAETCEPMRLEVRATEIPPELKLRSAGETMQYGHARIGASEFLLPMSSELSMADTMGHESRNLTRFEACKQYTGESTVHFDVDESASAAGQTAVAIALPPNLRLEASLRGPVDRAESARGDLLYATVVSDVKRSGKVIVPKGSVLTGRITRIQTRTVRSLVYFSVGLRFHAIEFGGRHGDFSAEVETAGIGTDYSVSIDRQTGESMIYIKTRVERLAPGTRLGLRTR
jgi:hypothetical protein